MSERRRAHVRVHGRVQGVFFRDATRREAEAAGVAGWVENRADGTVEAVFEGDPAAVERLIRFCESDPGHSAVERVDVTHEDPEDLTGFTVR